MAGVCLTVTKPIKELAKKIEGESAIAVANLVSLYNQDNNIDNLDYIPSAEKLIEFRDKLRKPENHKFGSIDFGDRYDTLVTKDNKAGIAKVAEKLGVGLKRNGNVLELTSNGASEEDMLLCKNLIADLFLSDKNVNKIFDNGQIRLDNYISWLENRRKNKQFRDVKAIYPLIAQARQNLRDVVDTRTKYEKQFDTLSSKMTTVTRDGVVEGMATWFSSIWTRRYEDYLNNTKNRFKELQEVENRTHDQQEEMIRLADEMEITREDFIKQSGIINEIFDEIKNRFTDYVTLKGEEQKKRLLNDIPLGEKMLSDTKISKNFVPMFRTILECFDVLSDNVCARLETTELISIRRNVWIEETTGNASQHDSENPESSFDDDDKLLEGFKENWMYEANTVSNYSRLPVQVRNLLSNCPMVSRTGVQLKTPLGTDKMLPVNTVLPELLEGLHGIKDSRDVIPALLAMSNDNPWVSTIINKLSADPNLKTMFYNNMKRARKAYGIFVSNGTGINMEIVNRANKTSSVAQRLKNTIASGNVLVSRNPTYLSNGKINRTNINARKNDIAKISALLKANDVENINVHAGKYNLVMKQFLTDNPTVLPSLVDHCLAIGLSTDVGDLMQSVLSNPIEKVANNNLSLLVDIISRYYDGISNDSNINTVDDILKKLSFNINDISRIFSNVDTTRVEQSVRQNGKTRYSFVLASDLDNIIEGLCGEMFDSTDYATSRRTNIGAIDFIKKKYSEDSYYYDKNFVDRNTGKKAGRYMSLWLDDIRMDGKIDMDYVEMLDYTDEKDRTSEFENWSNDTRVKMHYSMYNRTNSYTNETEHWYPIPVTSDVQTARYIKAPSYNRRKIVDGFQRVIMQELGRMVETGGLQNMSKTYKNNADKFCMLPFFNSYKGKNGKQIADELMKLKDSNYNEFDTRLTEMVNDYLNNEIDTYIDNNLNFVLNVLGVNDTAENVKAYVKNPNGFTFNNPEVKQKAQNLNTYIINSSYAQSQMISLFIGDPANFENYTDLQKRFKQVIVPKDSIDEFNEYAREITTNDGQKEGEGLQESCLYLDDVSAPSQKIRTLRKFYEEKVRRNEIKGETAERILDEFGKIKYTDGQAYRTPNGFKKILYMKGVMKKGDALDQALTNIFRGTFIEEDFDVVRKSGHSFVLKPFTSGLMTVDAGGGVKKVIPVQHKNSEQLLTAALQCAAMSLGQSGTLKGIAEYCDEHDIDVVMFNSAVKVGNTGFVEWREIKDGKEEKKNTDTMTAKEAKEFLERNAHAGTHFIPYSMYGTVSNVPEHGIDKKINIGTQLQKLIAADIPESAKFWFDGKSISKKKMLASYNAIYTEMIRRAYTEVTGLFADTERLSKKLQAAVLASSRGSNVLERAFSLDEFGNFIIPLCDLSTLNLSSEFLNSIIRKAVSKVEIDGGQFVQMSPFGLSESLKVEMDNSNGKRKVKYIECYLPEYTRQLSVFADMDGVIHPEDIPTELLQALGTRIPTEGKYFMAPLKIKGFLPALMPTSAIFPKDIVALTDSDFDVDKEPTILPTFRFRKYNFKKAYDDYCKLDDVKLERRQRKNRDLYGSGEVTPARRFGQWFKDVKNNYMNPSSEAYRAKDTANNVGGMTDNELKDKLLEAMYAMLTSADVVDQVVTAGDIGPAKAVAEEIKSMKGLTNEVMSPASINTVITQTERNNAGKNMIAVGAVANAMHAIEQHIKDSDKKIDFKINDAFKFSINGYENTSMTNIVARDGTLVSKNIGVCLGAAADNAKSPTLYYLNISSNTCNAAYLMLRLGYTPMDVGMFLNIPAVLEYSKTGVTPAYVKNLEDKSSYNLPGDQQMMRDVISGKKDGKEYKNYAYEAQALRIFKLLQENIGKDMHELDMLCRNDSGSSAPHGALESNIARQLKYHQYMYDTNVHYFDDWDKLFNTGEFDTAVENSMIPIAQAITSYSTFGAYEQMKNFYPGMDSDRFIPMMYNIIKRCYGGYITERNVKDILYSLYTFNNSEMESLKTINGSTEETRKWYMDNTEGADNFTNFAKRVIDANPRLKKMSFIANLKFGDETDGTPFITLSYDGSMIPAVRDQFISDWAQLFHSSDPDIVKLAQDLFIYSIYRNGSRYTNGSFAHLAPIEARTMLPGYIDELNEFVEKGKIVSNEKRFMIQFMRNNLNNPRMCRMIKGKMSMSGYWIDENKKTVDVFEVKPDQPYYNDFQNLANGSGCFWVFTNMNKEYYIAIKDGVDSDGNPTYKWHRTSPLGWKGKAYEFNSGMDAYKMNSIYDRAKVEANLNGKQSSAGPIGSDEPNDYYIPDEFYGQQYNEGPMTIESSSIPQGSSKQMTQDEEKALIEKIKNNKPGDTVTPDMLKYMAEHPELFLDPNNGWKSANGLPMC